MVGSGNFTAPFPARTPAERRAFRPLLEALEDAAAAFDRPVLVIHGDSHEFKVDHPLKARATGRVIGNLTRLEVPGSPQVGWVRVVVTPGEPPSFAFEQRLIPRWKYWSLSRLTQSRVSPVYSVMSSSGVTDASSSLDTRLRFAIANRRLIQLRYKGQLRVAEPHDYGVQKRVDRLFVYQLQDEGGLSARGWRLLGVQKIESCVVLEETFRGSRNQGQRHLEWDVVYARVD